MKKEKQRNPRPLPCQLLSGRKSLGIGTCNLFGSRASRSLLQHEADVQLPASDLDRLRHAFDKTERLTLKIQFKYPQEKALFYKVPCLISHLVIGRRDSAKLQVWFDGAVSTTTSAALSG